MYAKCVKGHVLKDANDWLLCENLPSPDSRCWQEGGETLFTLMARKKETVATAHEDAIEQELEGQPIPYLHTPEAHG